ncbi:MAG: spore maturation protein A [Clostridiales bacterium]|nr:spore maturation protein A [Clostridiales bacterium]
MSAISLLWCGVVIICVVYMILTGNSQEILESMLNSSKGAIELCISLAGVYCFWMGIIEVGSESGLMKGLSRLMMPALKRLFKNESEEAYEHISANFSANLIGAGNAATPAGINAVRALSASATKKGVATDNMMLFIVMNTSSLGLLPTTVISMRRLMGSQRPSSIMPGVLITSLVGTVTGVVLCKMLSRRKRGRV